ncbi:MAG: rhamnogalacturonan acetylesterase [Pseudomonadota bacterium]
MRSFIERPEAVPSSVDARRGRAPLAPSGLLILLSVSAAATPPPSSFDFAAGGNAATHPLFDAENGFGFEADAPAKFSVRLAEGNYRVTVRLGAKRAATRTAVRAEQRRLMLEETVTARGKFVERVFNVNIRTPALGELPANAPGGIAVKLKPRELGALNWDDKLTLEFIPDATALNSISIEPADVPTLYLAGDSTVTDQPVAPNASWGQVLPRFFDASVAVANHAESGETLKSFVTEMRFDKLLGELRTGDWVMIQFAHNDQKAQWPQTYADAATTYRTWLRTYTAEIRRRGATPILVTSPDRRNFDAAGHITSTLGDYPAAMRAVAGEEHLALVDLNASSRAFYEALGPGLAPAAFADSGRDKTHFNDYGAYNLARCVVEGLRSAAPALTAGLAAHLLADTARYDPSRPTPPPSLPAK